MREKKQKTKNALCLYVQPRALLAHFIVHKYIKNNKKYN